MSEILAKWLKESKSTVFFGGAGVSTESGIPDFRSAEGLYQKDYGTRVPPEEILSATFFRRYPEDFYAFYRAHMLFPKAGPNAAHKALAELEAMGLMDLVVTQNIDGLHQAAGSRNVAELHGTVLENYCLRCGKEYGLDAILGSTGIPRCSCGGMLKPRVTLYEEQLPDGVYERAAHAISRADLLIVGGTSLTVYPAAGLTRYFAGRHLAVINYQTTFADSAADLVLHASIGETLAKTVELLREGN